MKKKLPGEIVTLAARRESYDKLDSNGWYKKIISVLKDKNEPLTAREIATELFNRGLSNNCERQTVAPRLSELKLVGGVSPTDERKYDPISGVNVSAYVIGANYDQFL